MDYDVERENNIVKNIAKEIVIECNQIGIDATQELADYMVKLTLLNPKNGFTASEVMPRIKTQQLVEMVVEELKENTPEMNCIRLQVYWNSVTMNLNDLKKEFLAILTERAEPHLTELLNTEKEDISKFPKVMANYVLVSQNLGSLSHFVHAKETTVAVYSVFKNKDIVQFCSLSEEQKIEKINGLAKKVTGIRLFLKSKGLCVEGIPDVRKTVLTMIDNVMVEISTFQSILSKRVEDIRNVIHSLLIIDFFSNVSQVASIYLPPDFDNNDLKYLKKILVIMLQHNVYINEITSKLEEIDGNAHFYLSELDEVLRKLNAIIRDRQAVPTVEVYDEFSRAGEIWMEIQCCVYYLETIQVIHNKLLTINKESYFIPTLLEKAVLIPMKLVNMKNNESNSSLDPSRLILYDFEDQPLQFSGFCTWMLFCAEGFLVPGNYQAGVAEYQGKYYGFSSDTARELWSKEPLVFLREIHQNLRINKEMVELLNAYEELYAIKDIHLTKKVDWKVPTRLEVTQTVLHPIEKYWDKDYTFSQWELKNRALALSRLIKCTTKSSQTVNHSHFRASIGVLAAPNKDKEVQTKRDSSCVHSTIANYLYGLRGHMENKFKVISLTAPVEESCMREVMLKKFDPCSEKNRPKKKKKQVKNSVKLDPCHRENSAEKCDDL